MQEHKLYYNKCNTNKKQQEKQTNKQRKQKTLKNKFKSCAIFTYFWVWYGINQSGMICQEIFEIW